jgi:hypothetical protein
MSFKPGAANTAGRPRGSRNRLQGDFLRALAADFAEHGEGVIKIVRMEKPSEYLRIVASLMPKELTVESVFADLDDAALDELVLRIKEQLAAREKSKDEAASDASLH